MRVNTINNYNSRQAFKAKFLDTPAIRGVANWALKNGKFDQLNNARKQIDYSAVKVRINFDLATDLEGYPIVIFKRYFPKVINPQSENDYIISRPVVYKSQEKISPLEYGFKKIVQMGYYVTRNKLFKEVVRDASTLSDF